MTCRTCMSVSGLTKPIFNKEQNSGGPSLAQKLLKLAEVMVEPGDGLPEHICVACEKSINEYYAFKLKIEHWDKTMRELMEMEREKTALKEEVLMETHLASGYLNATPASKQANTMNEGEDFADINDAPAADLHSPAGIDDTDDSDGDFDIIKNTLLPPPKSNPTRKPAASSKTKQYPRTRNKTKVPPATKANAKQPLASNGVMNILTKCKNLTVTLKRVSQNSLPATADVQGVKSKISTPAASSTPAPKQPLTTQPLSFPSRLPPTTIIKKLPETPKAPLVIRPLLPPPKPQAPSSKPGNLPTARVEFKKGAYKCNICGSCFRYSYDLGAHRSSHFRCRKCDVVFTSTEELVDHTKHFHSLRFKCHMCGQCFGDTTDLYMHKRMHNSEITCEICGKLFAENKLRRHLHRHDNCSFKCHHCSQRYASRREWYRHVRRCINYMHPTNSVQQSSCYKCGTCDRLFQFQSALQAHQNNCTGGKYDPMVAFFMTYGATCD